MKIAYLVSEYPAVSHTFILQEILVLSKRGMQILRCSIRRPRTTGEVPEEARREQLQSFYVKEKVWHLWRLLRVILIDLRAAAGMLSASCVLICRDLGQGLRILGYLCEALILVDYLNQNSCKHIHVHFANAAATVAWLAKRSGRITFSLSVHGPDDFHDESRLFLKSKFEEATFIRCISYYTKSQVLRILKEPSQYEKVHVVHCGIDITAWVGKRSFQKYEREAPSPLKLLSIGRLVAAKGQFDLLTAVSMIFRAGRAVELKLIGSGPLEMDLRQHAQRLGISNVVSFLGAQSPMEIRSALERADLLVVTSHAEGLPVVIIEAMASRVVVLASDIHGIPELVIDGVTGFLLRPASPELVAEKIIELVHRWADLDAVREAASEKIREFDVNDTTAALGQVIEDRINELCA